MALRTRKCASFKPDYETRSIIDFALRCRSSEVTSEGEAGNCCVIRLKCWQKIKQKRRQKPILSLLMTRGNCLQGMTKVFTN